LRQQLEKDVGVRLTPDYLVLQLWGGKEKVLQPENFAEVPRFQ
jgi:hypothetical protein